MVQELQLDLKTEDVDLDGKVRPEVLEKLAARVLSLPVSRLNGVELLRLSLDARSKNPCYQARVRVYAEDSVLPDVSFDFSFPFQNGSFSHTGSFLSLVSASRSEVRGNSALKVVVAGMGPAGLFAALALASAGVRVVLLERGKPPFAGAVC